MSSKDTSMIDLKELKAQGDKIQISEEQRKLARRLLLEMLGKRADK